MTCNVTMTTARSATATFAVIPPNYVFVTSTAVVGNLGGLSGADATCQAAADARVCGKSQERVGMVGLAWASPDAPDVRNGSLLRSGTVEAV